jgi:DNA-binding NtrC family response regulator
MNDREVDITGAVERGHAPAATVLVVDDDPATVRTVGRMLRSLGYRVLEADDPEAAIRKVLETDVDLVLTDVMLPVMSGLALAHTVTALRPRTRLLWMSGYSLADLTRRHGVPVSGIDFLEKPLDPDTLAEAVDVALQVGDLDWDREDEAAASAEEGTPTVLMVDDDARALRSLARMLADLPVEVLTIPGPEEALALLSDADLRADLLIADIMMPTMSGIAMAREVSLLRPGMKVLYVSGEVRPTGPLTVPGAAGTESGVGVVGFMSKPVDVEAFRRTVMEMLGLPSPSGAAE